MSSDRIFGHKAAALPVRGPPKNTFSLSTRKGLGCQNSLLDEHGTTRRRNNELQFAGTYGEFGVRYTLKLPEGNEEVRSRQVMQLPIQACAVNPVMHHWKTSGFRLRQQQCVRLGADHQACTQHRQCAHELHHLQAAQLAQAHQSGVFICSL